MYHFNKYCPNYFRKKIMISDKLDASTVINMSSLYLYCKEIKIKNLEHSKNNPLLVLSPPLPFPPWLQNSPYFYVFKCVGTVKQKGLEWDCVQVQHTFFRFLCLPMGVWCSRTSLAWDSYSYTRLVPSRYLIVFWDERRLGIKLRRARGVMGREEGKIVTGRFRSLETCKCS